MPYEHKAIALDPVTVRKYAGKYADFELQASGNSLYKLLRSGRKIQFKAESSARFFRTGNTDEQLEFDTDGNGNVTKAWRVFYGVKTELKKLN
jgi:hypothetical protein